MLHNFVTSKPYEHVLPVFQELLAKRHLTGHSFEVTYATPDDVLNLNVRSEQLDTIDVTDVDIIIRTNAAVKMLTPMNYKLSMDGNTLLLATIMPIIEGTAEISFLVDTNFVNSSLKVRLTMLRFLIDALNELPFKRLQAKVRSDFTVGQNFVEHLGFEKEGLLRKWGPEDHDYIMYGRLS